MRDERQYRLGGIAAISACAFLWSIAGLFIKMVDWNPFAIAGIRSLIASLVMLAWIRKPRFTWSAAQILASLFLAATMLLFVVANKTTTAANAILLQYTAPVVAAVSGGILLKEKVHLEQWLAMVFIALGMVIFFMEQVSPGAALGNMLAVLSGLTFGLYSVFMRKQKRGSPFESALLGHWMVAGTALVACLFMPVPVFTAKSALAILVLGIFQIGFASILFATAIKRITAVETMLLAVIEPLFNPFWVFLATGEKPSVNALAGGGIIVAAVTAATIVSVRLAPSRAEPADNASLPIGS